MRGDVHSRDEKKIKVSNNR